MTETNFSESDFEELKFDKCSKSSKNDFLEVINSETLAKKVSKAINLKMQGHFNKAVLYITEANRDQVTAIRKVQYILDKLENQEKTEIVFDKFQQTLPLQIGISNGKGVLELLYGIGNHFKGDQSKKTYKLHQVEEYLDNKREELIFFQERMKGKISAEELDHLKEKVAKLVRKTHRVKKQIADTLIEFVIEKYKELVAEDRLLLISNLFLMITSSIETKDSQFATV